jgi:hypothetical protein
MKLKDHVAPILAIITVVAFLSYAIAVTFIPHKADLGLINVIFGWLGGTTSTIIAYYFGSSHGSEKKNDIISKMRNDNAG